MKLSIITPVYKDLKLIPKFLEEISKQTSKDFELILVIDTNSENVLEKIDEFKNLLADKLKIVYNSKRIGRQKAISSAFRFASGEYVMFLSSSNLFNDNMVKDLIDLINKNKSDVIEFQARIKKPFNFLGNQRKKFFKNVIIEENPEVFAYFYLMEFNKLFKKEILDKVYAHPLINAKINSRHSIEVSLKAMIYAKTYSNSDTVIINSRKELTSSFNPLKLFREWESILKDNHFNKFHSEIMYNFYFSSAIIISAQIGSTKNKILLNKYKDKFSKFFSETSFFKTNKYLLMNNKETEILKKNESEINVRAYREL